MTFILQIPLKPTPRPRIRVARNGGRFYPRDYTEWRKKLLTYIEDELYKLDITEFPLYEKQEKVSLTIRCSYEKLPRYKSHDVDSLAATILDALTGLAYEDDSQVHRLLVEKTSAEKDKIQIYISEIK